MGPNKSLTNELGSIKSRIELLPRKIDALTLTIENIEGRMDVLKKAGLIYAKPHWRNQKYFLLVHPMKKGERKSPTYIGTDEGKIQQAHDGIARAEEFDKLSNQLEAYRREVSKARSVLRDLELIFG